MTSKRTTRKLRNRSNRQTGRFRGLKPKKLLALCLFTLFFSCGRPALYDQYQVIENTTWEKNKEYYFTFQVEEVDVPYDITLEIRNNNLYPYQNLWLFCNEEHPFGPLKRDTVECLLADEFGKWYGRGISLFQSSFPIRARYFFPYPGQYTFGFRQGMRHDALPGIQEIGLRVEKTANAPSATHPAAEK